MKFSKEAYLLAEKVSSDLKGEYWIQCVKDAPSDLARMYFLMQFVHSFNDYSKSEERFAHNLKVEMEKGDNPLEFP